MTVYLLRITNAVLRNPAPEFVAEPEHWRLYASCGEADADSCQLLQSIATMQAARDQKDALAALAKLVHVAASGKPLQTFYDEKQCHVIHRFHHAGRERVVWRIRRGSVRIAFYYGNGRLIFLADAVVKRKNTLSQAEKSELERKVIEFVNAEQAGTLRLFDFVPSPANPGAAP